MRKSTKIFLGIFGVAVVASVATIVATSYAVYKKKCGSLLDSLSLTEEDLERIDGGTVKPKEKTETKEYDFINAKNNPYHMTLCSTAISKNEVEELIEKKLDELMKQDKKEEKAEEEKSEIEE